MSVSNDLYTDPRVDKVCRTLADMGAEVTLIGCRHRHSPRIAQRNYQIRRLFLFFKKGAAFYAELNVKLFFYLLFRKFDLLVSNDLDTLLPNYLASRLRRKNIVYDSHEYFCHMVTVIHKPLVRKIWMRIEKFCFPRLEHIITVSHSIAKAYQEQYGKEVKVVRNIPPEGKPPVTETRQSLGLPEDKAIILMQGNDISANRGAEELVEAMPYVENGVLLFVGNGSLIEELKKRVRELNLGDKVFFVGRVDQGKLFQYTYLSDIGASLERATSLNQVYSLPNKIFEYIKAETPLLVSDLQERVSIIEHYRIGTIVRKTDPKTVSDAINEMIRNKELYAQYKENCKIAARELTWENEQKVIREIYTPLIIKNS